jgi:hypothetical protein
MALSFSRANSRETWLHIALFKRTNNLFTALLYYELLHLDYGSREYYNVHTINTMVTTQPGCNSYAILFLNLMKLNLF